MKRIQKIILGAMGVALLSASVSAGVYSLMERRSARRMASTEIDGGAFRNAAMGFDMSRSVGNAPDLVPAAEASVHSVVHIKVEGEQQIDQSYMDPFEFFFGGGSGSFDRPSSRPVVGYGSGVIISTDGYIITNNHVIDNANKISVTLNDNRTLSAKLIGSDPAGDIALIKVDAEDLPTIPFGNSDALKVGEWVLAVGNPFNLTSTVTAGIVSAKARSTASEGGSKIGGFIQTDAAVNPGNSGGALVNAAGELVGINTMIYSQTGNYAGYSFAVPINSAAKVVADIKKFGSVQRAVLGIGGTDVTSEIKEKLGLKVNEGVVVTTFAERSGAFSAGMEEHDVITAVDGKPVKNMAQLQDLISIRRPGDKVEVTVNRKGSTKMLKVTLKNEEGGEQIIHNDPKVMLGAQLKALTNEQKRAYGVSYGVAVAKVGDGKFKEAGIKEGFIILSVNNKPVRSVEEARRAITQVQQSRRGDGSLLLKGFYPNGRTKYYVIDLL